MYQSNEQLYTSPTLNYFDVNKFLDQMPELCQDVSVNETEDDTLYYITIDNQ